MVQYSADITYTVYIDAESELAAKAKAIAKFNEYLAANRWGILKLSDSSNITIGRSSTWSKK